MNARDSIPDRIFVTGTDTDVGKTIVAASICAGLEAGYWKPIQAGTEPLTDTERVQKWSGLPESHFYPEQYRLALPASPHAAAEEEGIEINLDHFRIPGLKQKRLVVEGAGGILVPVNRKEMILDLIVRLNLPVLLVARSGLGTINHTLMSIRILREKNAVRLWGVVLNGPRHVSNEEAIRHFGKVKRLFSFPQLEQTDPEGLKSAFEQTFLQHASS